MERKVLVLITAVHSARPSFLLFHHISDIDQHLALDDHHSDDQPLQLRTYPPLS